ARRNLWRGVSITTLLRCCATPHLLDDFDGNAKRLGCCTPRRLQLLAVEHRTRLVGPDLPRARQSEYARSAVNLRHVERHPVGTKLLSRLDGDRENSSL